MTKQQILNTLYPVRQAYREAIEDIQAFYSDDPYDYLYGRDMELGMCLVMININDTGSGIDDNWCTLALIEDLLLKKKGSFWYPVAEEYLSFPDKIIPKCLQPRLDHLNRTIARLENEINEYT